MQSPAKDYFKSAASGAFPQTKMQTPEKDFLAGTTTSTRSGFHSIAQSDAPDQRDTPAGTWPVSLPWLPFQLAMNLPVSPPGTLLPPSTPAPLGKDGPGRREALHTLALFAASSLGQPAWPNLTYFHCMLGKGAKNKTGLCCLHFKSVVSDSELQKNSPGTVQAREKMLFPVNCLNSIDYPTLVPI